MDLRTLFVSRTEFGFQANDGNPVLLPPQTGASVGAGEDPRYSALVNARLSLVNTGLGRPPSRILTLRAYERNLSPVNRNQTIRWPGPLAITDAIGGSNAFAAEVIILHFLVRNYIMTNTTVRAVGSLTRRGGSPVPVGRRRRRTVTCVLEPPPRTDGDSGWQSNRAWVDAAASASDGGLAFPTFYYSRLYQ